jgi:hypothetical protein
MTNYVISSISESEWTLKMMEANVNTYNLGLHNLLDYLERV